MEWNRKRLWQTMAVVCAGVAFYVLLQHLDVVIGAVGWLLGIASPFLIGGALAFVLNVPMRAIERRLPHRRGRGRLRRAAALLTTLCCLLGVLALATLVIEPNVGEAIVSLRTQLPGAADTVQRWLTSLSAQIPALGDTVSKLNVDWSSLMNRIPGVLQKLGDALLSSGGSILSGVVGTVANVFIGIVFSMYILLQKEALGRQGRQCLYALLPRRGADQIREILTLADGIFAGFLSGQCLEAVILGTLFVVCMTLFRMPYALLVGVLIALTALIPIIGAFIGCGVGALLIAVTDPWKALAFVVLFLVLQQIEGNLIYPHVVGSSVGLPSIWVLFAVTVGGKLFGVAGMVVFIPLCSVLYALFRNLIRRRLAQRNIPPEVWAQTGRTGTKKAPGSESAESAQQKKD